MAGAPLGVSSAKDKLQYRRLRMAAGAIYDGHKKVLEDRSSNYHFFRTLIFQHDFSKDFRKNIVLGHKWWGPI